MNFVGFLVFGFLAGHASVAMATGSVPGGLSGQVVDASNPSTTTRGSDDLAMLQAALPGSIKDQFVDMTGSQPEQFQLVSFTSQVVAGTNYFVKVKTGQNSYAHLRIFKPLPFQGDDLTLSAVLLGKSLNEPITYFDQPPLTATMPMMMAGAVGSVVQVSDVSSTSENSHEVSALQQALSAEIRQQFSAQTCSNPSTFELVSYSKQLVAGTNYFAKVKIDNGEFVHLRIFKPLQENQMQLDGIQSGKGANEPVDYFDRTCTTILPDCTVTQTPLLGGAAPNQQNLPGGLSSPVIVKDVSLDGREDEAAALQTALSNEIKTQFLQNVGSQPKMFELISYSTQVVAGTNYFAKVKVDDNSYVHLRIFKPLEDGQPMQLAGVLLGKSRSDAVEYFTEAATNETVTMRSVIGRPGGIGPVVNVGDVSSSNGRQDEIATLQRALSNEIKRQYADQTGMQPTMFELVSYASQVVAGTNYFAKVKVGANDYAHLRIFKPLSGAEMQLSAVQQGKLLTDSIDYFSQSAVTTTTSTTTITTTMAQRRLGGVRGYVNVTDSVSAASNGDEIAQLRAALKGNLKTQFVDKTGVSPSTFELVSYASQVVAGRNYFAKVQIGANEYAHLRIFKPLGRDQPMQLTSAQLGKMLNDEIIYF